MAPTLAAGRSMPLACALSLLCGLVAVRAAGAAEDRVGSYDFAYRLAGDARAKPVQVFDDGSQTYFQFRQGEAVPAIFVDGAAGPRLLHAQAEGPYLKVPALADGFALRLGLGAASVTYIGGTRRRSAEAAPGEVPAAPVPATRSPRVQPAQHLLASIQPVTGLPRDMLLPPGPRISLEESSYATPLRGDAIEWTAGADRVREVALAFGKDDAVLTPNALRQLRAAAAARTAATRFEILVTEDTTQRNGLSEARARSIVSALWAAGADSRAVTQKVIVGDPSGAGNAPRTVATLRIADPSTRAIPGGGEGGGRRPPVHQAVTVDTAPEPAPKATAVASTPTPVWAVRKEDGTLNRMLARWAGDAGWTLVWRAGPTVAITGDTSLTRADYLQAADYALEQARGAGYRLRGTAYSNQVLVITSEE